MLSLALAATLVGFVLLILGLITGTVWLAISCIVVCLIGLGFLIVDIIFSGRRARASGPDTVFGDDRLGDDRAAESRADAAGSGTSRDQASSTGPSPRVTTSMAPDGTRRLVTDGVANTPDDPVRPGYNPESGPISGPVATGSEAVSTQRFDQSAPPTAYTPAAQPTARMPEAPRVEGDYDDYLRSIGGLPSQAQQGQPQQGPPQQGPPQQTPPQQAQPQQASPQQGWPVRQDPNVQEQQGPPAQSGRPQRGPRHQGPPAQQASEPQGPSSGRRRKIDPLDPDWRPSTR